MGPRPDHQACVWGANGDRLFFDEGKYLFVRSCIFYGTGYI